MSRSRKTKPFPKRTKDRDARRLRFVCTCGGENRVQTVDEFSLLNTGGRPDLQTVMRRVNRAVTPDVASWDRLGRCPKCNRGGEMYSELHIEELLKATSARVLRYDISTRRLLK